MRKSDYPEYFGGRAKSRGPRTFRYWCECLREYYSSIEKKYRKRNVLIMFLKQDCQELNR